MNESARINRIRRFQKAIETGKYEHALKLATRANDLIECEIYAIKAASNRQTPIRILTATLDAFAEIHDRKSVKHGEWVHSLSHLLWILWERRLTSWIKKFHFIAFQGARESSDIRSCDRLVHRFVILAKWSDDPAKFHLTSENLELVRQDWLGASAIKRIEAAPFHSDADFLRWEFKHADLLHGRFEGMSPILMFKYVHLRIKRLKNEGVDVTEFVQKEKLLIAHELKWLENRLENAQSDWEQNNIAKKSLAIAKFLESVAYSGLNSY